MLHAASSLSLSTGVVTRTQWSGLVLLNSYRSAAGVSRGRFGLWNALGCHLVRMTSEVKKQGRGQSPQVQTQVVRQVHFPKTPTLFSCSGSATFFFRYFLYGKPSRGYVKNNVFLCSDFLQRCVSLPYDFERSDWSATTPWRRTIGQSNF